MSLSPRQLAAANRLRDEKGHFLPSSHSNRSTHAKNGLKSKSKSHPLSQYNKGNACHPGLSALEGALILSLLEHRAVNLHHKSPIKHISDAQWMRHVANARKSAHKGQESHSSGSWEAKLAHAKANAFSPSACAKKRAAPHSAKKGPCSPCGMKSAGNYGYNKDGSLFLVLESEGPRRSPSKHVGAHGSHKAHIDIAPCAAMSHHKSASKHHNSAHKRDHHVNTDDYNCKTWAGCVYSAVAADARAQGLKVEGGINGLHKILHYTKTHYPAIHEALVSDPNAWKRNAALAKKIRELYVELD